MVDPNLIEEWRPVVGWEDLYRVSSLGRLWSIRAGIVMRPHASTRPRRGYLQTMLSRNGIRQNVYVHLVVAAAFLGPKPPGKQVHHRDGHKANNIPTNLEYVTAAQNVTRSFTDLGRQAVKQTGEANGAHILTAETVRFARALRAEGQSYDAIAKRVGAGRETIRRLLIGLTWRHIT